MEELAAHHPIPMYWVRPRQILSAEAGMHRFVWDVHYPPPHALNMEFPISAIVHNTPLHPLGAWALPGNYTVKLTVDGKSYSRQLTLIMDPRIKTSAEDLAKQHEMEMGAVEGMDESLEELQQVQSVRAQLKDVASKAKGKLAEQIDALDKQCAELQGATQSGFFGLPPSGKRPETISTLNQHFAAILATADSADATPTTQATGVYHELDDASTALRKRWNALNETALLDLNQSLKQSGLPTIDPKKPLADKPTDDSDGDDEP
jgi:hypothetical protein